MDANIAIGLAAFLIQLFVLIGGTYAFVLKRETQMVARMDKMHEEQDKRIQANEDEAKAIKNNYITKFAELRKDVNDGNIQTMNTLHSFETAIRSSIHGLREDIAAWFGKQEARNAK